MTLMVDRSRTEIPSGVASCSYAFFDLQPEPERSLSYSRFEYGNTTGVVLIEFGARDEPLASARNLYARTVDDSTDEPPDIVVDDDFEI